jgi:hypothetical protein
MYARGILFGKMKYELGDHSYVRCPELGLSADIEFKTKGYFGGTYNAIGGTIKNEAGEILYEIGGMWTGEVTIKEMAVRLSWINSFQKVSDTILTRNHRADWEERRFIQCSQVKTHTTNCSITGGARRT